MPVPQKVWLHTSLRQPSWRPSVRRVARNTCRRSRQSCPQVFCMLLVGFQLVGHALLSAGTGSSATVLAASCFPLIVFQAKQAIRLAWFSLFVPLSQLATAAGWSVGTPVPLPAPC